jgi:Tfp pilus assembly protein PilP
MSRRTVVLRSLTVAAMVGGALLTNVSAQTPPAAAQTSSAAPAAPPAPAEIYSYNPEGRRDPFVSLMFRGADQKAESRPAGPAGLGINEISIRGIIRDRASFVAMITGPDNKTHIVHQNDKLFDGSVKAITADSVIFSQNVNDPLSLVKQREVRKYLRVTQEGK